MYPVGQAADRLAMEQSEISRLPLDRCGHCMSSALCRVPGVPEPAQTAAQNLSLNPAFAPRKSPHARLRLRRVK